MACAIAPLIPYEPAIYFLLPRTFYYFSPRNARIYISFKLNEWSKSDCHESIIIYNNLSGMVYGVVLVPPHCLSYASIMHERVCGARHPIRHLVFQEGKCWVKESNSAHRDMSTSVEFNHIRSFVSRNGRWIFERTRLSKWHNAVYASSVLHIKPL